MRLWTIRKKRSEQREREWDYALSFPSLAFSPYFFQYTRLLYLARTIVSWNEGFKLFGIWKMIDSCFYNYSEFLDKWTTGELPHQVATRESHLSFDDSEGDRNLPSRFYDNAQQGQYVRRKPNSTRFRRVLFFYFLNFVHRFREQQRCSSLAPTQLPGKCHAEQTLERRWMYVCVFYPSF